METKANRPSSAARTTARTEFQTAPFRAGSNAHFAIFVFPEDRLLRNEVVHKEKKANRTYIRRGGYARALVLRCDVEIYARLWVIRFNILFFLKKKNHRRYISGLFLHQVTKTNLRDFTCRIRASLQTHEYIT